MTVFDLLLGIGGCVQESAAVKRRETQALMLLVIQDI